MKNRTILITAFCSAMLFSCGGSEQGTSNTSKSDVKTTLTNTTWKSECSLYSKIPTDNTKELWNITIKLTIDSSLKATYRTEFFHPTDKACEVMMFDALDVSTFKVTGKVITDESIEANGLNETFIYNSDNRDLPTNYTLIYMDSEKLYFGQNSGSNLGETPETRHSSISLDNYFTQITN
ncbi:hypothetical protein [Thalassotalea hakodatensis]|uniref:hypothetical protein n=1 Tax=Thalassotalea hakodatensis TaxID=3030492 RepID=UPI0025725763|nr:hypothetical protein [Thalassotalea hakodatensis]